MRDMQLKLTTTVQRRRHMETTTIYLYVQLTKKNKTKSDETYKIRKQISFSAIQAKLILQFVLDSINS